MTTKTALSSKTVWFSVLLIVLPALSELGVVLADTSAPPWVLSLIGTIVLILRIITRQPVRMTKNNGRSGDQI